MKKYLFILLALITGVPAFWATFSLFREETKADVALVLLTDVDRLRQRLTEDITSQGQFVSDDRQTILETFVRQAIYYHQLLSLTVHSQNGGLLFSTLQASSPSPLGDDPERVMRDRAWQGHSFVNFEEKGSGAEIVAHVYIPLVRDGIPFAVLTATYAVGDLWVAIGGQNDRLMIYAFGLIALIIVLALWAIRRTFSGSSKDKNRAIYLAANDTLSGLHNRAFFDDSLETIIKRSAKKDKKTALFLINVDRFRDFNTAYGASVADQLIKEIAKLLQRVSRPGDSLFRLGGGEFAIISEGAVDNAELSLFGEGIIEKVAAIRRLNRVDVSCSVSISVAIAPEDGKTGEALLTSCHLAMERAHKQGRGIFCYFEASRDLASRQRKYLEDEMRGAVYRQEFRLHYQPQFNSLTGRLVGFESLIRWQHPEKGMISPAEFIPLAEETGLIVEIGHWIIRRACKDALAWAQPVKVAVNLSPIQFEHENIAMLVAYMLDRTGFPPQRLEIEITESMLVDKAKEVSDVLRTLSAMGVRVAMDDFGTGYSSLATLARFDFHKLKIDRSFILMMEDQKGSEAIVQFVIKLGQALGVDVLAEGVETWEQVEVLRQLGCNLIQGYYFGKPMTQAEILKSFEEGGFEKELPPFIPRREHQADLSPFTIKSIKGRAS